MKPLQAGTIIELEVVRETDFGYFLSNGLEDVLLHRREMKIEKMEIGDYVEVFLYHDHQNRLTATMQEPVLVVGEAGWLKVKELHPDYGAFLDQQISRDLLLPKSELPPEREEWPMPGDHVFVQLAHDRQGRVLAKLSDAANLIKEAQPGGEELKNKPFIGTVYKLFPIGAFLISEEEHILFLPRTEMKSTVRLGQTLPVRVTYVRSDGRLNVATRPLKQDAMATDAQKIVDYLHSRNGSMPYSDTTAPDLIQERFHMSKAAFKRALGHLMKKNQIVQKDGWTYLKEKL